AGDFETIERLWGTCAMDSELETVFVETAAELAQVYDAEIRAHGEATVAGAVERHMPSAELIRPLAGPLTVAEVADFIRRRPPAGLTTDELKWNDRLLCQTGQLVPAELGMSQVLDWGRRFGSVPETYWRAFRQAALKLRMRRGSDLNYQMAAR